MVTFGGKNIGAKYGMFRAFVAALGVQDFEHFGINSSRVEDGKIRTVDGNARLRAIRGFLRHSSPPDIWRMVKYIRLIRVDEDNRFLGGPGFTGLAAKEDKTLDRVFGRYLRAQLVRSLTVRMNGAEPDETYIGNFGTNLGMVMDRFDQLSGGFEPVYERFRELVDVHLQHSVDRINIKAGQVTGITTSTTDGVTTDIDADVVVIAVPSWDAAALLSPNSETLAAALREITYFPVAVALAEYEKDVFSETVRALVFPPESALSNAGAYGVDERQIVRYTFSGRSARRLLSDNPPTDKLIDAAEKELDPYIPVSGIPRLNVSSASWERGLCAYGKDHAERLGRIGQDVKEIQGVALSGDYLLGASIEACFRSAKVATDTVMRQIHPAGQR